MARTGTINMRRWPRSSTQLRATVIQGTGVPVSVLTTAAGHPSSSTQHSYPIGALTTVGVFPRPLTTKGMSFSVLTTAAAYMATGGTVPIDHPVGVLTTAGAHAPKGYGYAPLLDENGDPILDEFGFPILVAVQGITKNSNGTILVTGAVWTHATTVPSTNIATAVLTMFGGSVASVTTHQFTFGALTTVGVSDNAGPLARSTPISVDTPAAADSRAATAHNVATPSHTSVAASAQAAVAHSSPIFVTTTTAAHSGAGVTHNVSVSVATTGAVYTFGLIPATNTVTVAVYTSAGAATSADAVLKAASVAGLTTGAASTLAPTTRATSVVVHTSGAVETHADELTHSTTIEGVLTTLAAVSGVDVSHEVSVASMTFAAGNAEVLALRDALIEALTTGAGYTQFSEILVQLCVAISATADQVQITVEADTVDISVERC